MSGLSKGEKWLARAMVPGFVGVAALCYLAWRPCEPVAQAAEAPVLQVGTVEIVGSFIPEVDVESLPRVSAKGVAHPAAKPAMDRWTEPPRVCGWYPLLQGTVGSKVWACNPQ